MENLVNKTLLCSDDAEDDDKEVDAKVISLSGRIQISIQVSLQVGSESGELQPGTFYNTSKPIVFSMPKL